jgi:hypothetical protein
MLRGLIISPCYNGEAREEMLLPLPSLPDNRILLPVIDYSLMTDFLMRYNLHALINVIP